MLCILVEWQVKHMLEEKCPLVGHVMLNLGLRAFTHTQSIWLFLFHNWGFRNSQYRNTGLSRIAGYCTAWEHNDECSRTLRNLLNQDCVRRCLRAVLYHSLHCRFHNPFTPEKGASWL